MGWCHEFGPQIKEGCDHPMQAGPVSCTCTQCGVVCEGRFPSCPDVWARGPRRVELRSNVAVLPPRRGANPEDYDVLTREVAVEAPGPAGIPPDLERVLDDLRSDVRAISRSVSRPGAALPELVVSNEIERRLDDLASALREEIRSSVAGSAEAHREPLHAAHRVLETAAQRLGNLEASLVQQLAALESTRAALRSDRIALQADRASVEAARTALADDRVGVEAARTALADDRVALGAERKAVEEQHSRVTEEQARQAAVRERLELDRTHLDTKLAEQAQAEQALATERAQAEQALAADRAAAEQALAADRAALQKAREELDRLTDKRRVKKALGAITGGREDLAAERAALEAARRELEAQRQYLAALADQLGDEREQLEAKRRAASRARQRKPGAAWVTPRNGRAPKSYPVKVKVASGIYHVPGMPAYDRTTPDRCYATAKAAEADGFRRAKR